MVLLDFPAELKFATAVMIETPGGDLYPESAAAIRRVTLAYEQVAALALTPGESAEVIRDACARYAEEGQP